MIILRTETGEHNRVARPLECNSVSNQSVLYFNHVNVRLYIVNLPLTIP